MPETEEMNSTILYRNYGIDDWHEKSQVLTIEERIQILTELKMGIDSPLVRLATLPFPTFVAEYFEGIPSARIHFEDPEFAYKLYFLDDYTLRFFTEKMRNARVTNHEICALHGFPITGISWKDTIETIEETPFEEFAKINTYKAIDNYLPKFLKLARFIDLEEAKRIGLNVVSTFVGDGVDGYEIDTKLSRLNPGIRHMIELYLGLYGHRRHSLEEIALQVCGISKCDKISNLVRTLLPKLLKSTREFEYFIGYKEHLQTEGNYIEYTSKDFREINIYIETRAIIVGLSESEREILARQRGKARDIYLAAKYMYKTPESLARNLNISLADAKERLKS